MRNTIVLGSLALVAVCSQAEGYVGGSFLLNKHVIGCAENNACSNKMGGYQLLAGARLSDRFSFKTDEFALDTVEIGLSKFGRIDASRSVVGYYYPTVAPRKGLLTARAVPATTSVSSNALYSALIARAKVIPDVELTGKLGLAYVSSTSHDTREGVSVGSQTENHFAPLFGLGAEYTVMEGLGVSVDLATTNFKINGESGRLRSLGIGVRYHY
jgi:hypothetical protein